MIKRRDFKPTAADVVESWHRIESCLKANRPESVASLRDGASDERVGYFEGHTGQELPSDVRRTWQIHDGQAWDRDVGPAAPGVVFDVALLPLLDPYTQSALAIWRDRRRVKSDEVAAPSGGWSSYPTDSVRPMQWCEGWIPLGIDRDGNVLAVDLDPSANGTIGQIIAIGVDDPVRYVLGVDWAHFLEDVADELNVGGGWAGEDDRARPPVPERRASLLDVRAEWSRAKLGASGRRVGDPAVTEGSGRFGLIAGPDAEECIAVVHGFVEAMYAYDRYWLALRPLRPFGYSQLSESRHSGNRIHAGNSGIEDRAEGRAEADLVRLMDDRSFDLNAPASRPPGRLTEAERERVLRVGVYFDEAIRRKRPIYERYWHRMSDREDNYFTYSDPSKFDPATNQIAETRRVSRDHIVTLFERETETGYPFAPGVHLKLIGDRWLITKLVHHREEILRLRREPMQRCSEAASQAARHPSPEAIARAREMCKILEGDPLLDALQQNGGDLFGSLTAVGASYERNEFGDCVSLNLAGTAVTDIGMARLAGLTQLKRLVLGPSITDDGLAHLTSMSELTELIFGEGGEKPFIQGPGFEYLRELPKIQRLDLSLLPLTDASLAHLHGPPGLREINILQAPVTDAGLACLTAFSNLQRLTLRNTQITGSGLAHLVGLESLEELDLDGSAVEDSGLIDLPSFPALKVLGLGRTKITDVGLVTLSQLTGLRRLDLREKTNVSSEGVETLQKALPGCRVF